MQEIWVGVIKNDPTVAVVTTLIWGNTPSSKSIHVAQTFSTIALEGSSIGQGVLDTWV